MEPRHRRHDRHEQNGRPFDQSNLKPGHADRAYGQEWENRIDDFARYVGEKGDPTQNPDRARDRGLLLLACGAQRQDSLRCR
jgi:hypothetical protein